MSPLIQRAKQELTMRTDDKFGSNSELKLETKFEQLLISIACGTILAVLTVSFFI